MLLSPLPGVRSLRWDRLLAVPTGGRRPRTVFQAWARVALGVVLAMGVGGAATAGSRDSAHGGSPQPVTRLRVKLAAAKGLAEGRTPGGAPQSHLAAALAERGLVMTPALGTAARLEGLRRVSAASDRSRPSVGKPPQPAALTEAAAGAAAIERLSRWYTVDLSPEPHSGTGGAGVGGTAIPPDVIRQLRAEPGVEAVEIAVPAHPCAVPGDPAVVSQPYLGLIDAFLAYDVVRGSDGDVVVAVVDGGTDWQHVDLLPNIWQRPGEVDNNGVDDDGNGYVDDVRGWNFPASSADPRGLAATPFNGRHGTHIAGLIGAVSDNGIGVSGVSWNARLLPVNVGHPSLDNVFAYGYEGLIYAGLSGARIANASWGRRGRWSQYEADVIAAVTAMGTLVVAAAGNDGAETAFYPAYYPGVLSVTAVDPNRARPPFSNYGPWIDVCAPGVSTYSTFPDNGYDSLTGTSQAAAVVSGVAALLATQRGEFGPAQLAEQLRWTSRSVRVENPTLDERLGTGLVQARAALLEHPPGIVARRLVVTDEDGDGLPEPGELLTVGFDLRNELADAQEISLTLLSEDPAVTVLESSLRLTRLASGAELGTRKGLRLWVRPEATTPGDLASIRVRIEAGGRRVHCGFNPELAPLHATLRSQRVHLTVTSSGKIGYSAFTRTMDPGGEGLHPPGGASRLLVGSLLVGDGPSRVSDASIDPSADDLYEDFHPQEGQGLSLAKGGEADEEVVGRYTDRAALAPLEVNVRQVSRAFHDAARGGFVLSRFEVTAARQALTGVRVGVLVDWEVASGRGGDDRVGWDPTRRMGYGFDAAAQDDGPAAGAVLLEGPGTLWGGWLYEEATEGYDGPTLFGPPPRFPKISDADLWELMTRTPDAERSPAGDVAQVLAMGPIDLEVGETTVLVVALVVGDDLATLLREADAARVQYDAFQAGFPQGMPARPVLLPNAPNPFNPTTELRFTLPAEARVRLRVIDARGRLVGVPLDAPMPAGFHRVPWGGSDGGGARVASGVYHVLLETPWGALTRSVTLLQ